MICHTAHTHSPHLPLLSSSYPSSTQSTQLDNASGDARLVNSGCTTSSNDSSSNYSTISGSSVSNTSLGAGGLRVEPGKKKMTVLRRLKKTTSAVMRGVGLSGGAIKVSKTKTAPKLAPATPISAQEAVPQAVAEVQNAVDPATAPAEVIEKKAAAVLAPMQVSVPIPLNITTFRMFESPKHGERLQPGVPALVHEAPSW